MDTANINLIAGLVCLEAGRFDVGEFLRLLEDGSFARDGAFLLQLDRVCNDPDLLSRLRSRVDDVSKSTGLNASAAATVGFDGHAAASATGATVVKPHRYSRVAVHASGGLGRVWDAYDTELHRKVALKELLPARLESADARRQLEDEAKLTGSLEHPSVAPVYGLCWDADGSPCYAMRFVSGLTFEGAVKRHLSAQEPPTRRAAEFQRLLSAFISVCNATQCAHLGGIVHRDIKPKNIVLGELGEAYLVDWGLAYCPGQEGGGGASGSPTDAARHIVGTPMYMSPEQAWGDSVGPASDVYSLGATLYFLLTGKGPFEPVDSEPPCGLEELLANVRAGQFERPRHRNSRLDTALERICLSAMQRDAARRPASARALAVLIEEYQADLPLRHWRRAVSHFQEQVANEPEEVEFRHSLATARYNLGVAFWGQQRFTESEHQLQESLALLQELHSDQGVDVARDLAGVCLSLARVFAQSGQKQSARTCYTDAQRWLETHLKSRGREPRPELMHAMFAPSDVGFMRFLRD